MVRSVGLRARPVGLRAPRAERMPGQASVRRGMVSHKLIWTPHALAMQQERQAEAPMSDALHIVRLVARAATVALPSSLLLGIAVTSAGWTSAVCLVLAIVVLPLAWLGAQVI